MYPCPQGAGWARTNLRRLSRQGCGGYDGVGGRRVQGCRAVKLSTHLAQIEQNKAWGLASGGNTATDSAAISGRRDDGVLSDESAAALMETVRWMLETDDCDKRSLARMIESSGRKHLQCVGLCGVCKGVGHEKRPVECQES